MGKELSKEEMDKIFEDLIKSEVEFCEELDLEMNEHGVYIYTNGYCDGKSSINVPMVLQHYKEWLIEKRIVKEV